MANKYRFAPLLIAVLGGLIAAFFLFGKPAPEKREASPPAPLAVEIIELSPKQRPIKLLSQGIIRAKQAIDWQSEVAGRVIEVSDKFADGAFFEAGELMLRIDPSNYQTALSSAIARVAEAEQALAQERGRALQAKREWRDLGDDNANALFLRKPQIAAAKAQLAAAKAQQQQAEKDLANTELRAPFNGRIDRIRANLGQLVNSNTPIASIYASDSAEIRLPLSEKQQKLLNLPIAPGKAIAARVIDDQGKRRKAVIRRSDASLDERTRLLYVIADINDPMALKGKYPSLQIGDFVRAEIRSRAIPQVLFIPREALRGRDEIWSEDQGQLRKHKVEVLQIQEQTLVVRLLDQDITELNLITTPLARANEGLALTVVASSDEDAS